jgi:hypothetical protein
MPSADFRLPRIQGHAINVLISVLLWLGIAAIAHAWVEALHWSPRY